MPAFPQAYTSTVSHWQETNRGPTSLWNHGREAKLPVNTIDYVIVGAGATGASLAYQLSRPRNAEGKSVVVLDAKDVASCASGRNGGHVAPHAWQAFPVLMAPLEKGGAGLTAEQVLDVVFFEQDNLDIVDNIVSTEGLDVDFWRGSRLEVLTTPESAAQNLRFYELIKSLMARSSKYRDRVIDWEIITDPTEAKRVSRIKNAVQVNRIPAGSWHPHRGVTALLALAMKSTTTDVKFFSWAPVAGISNNADGTIAVDCGTRGIATARNVIMATNAYTRHLLPEVEDLMVPWRGQAGLVVPPATYAGPRGLIASYAVKDGPYLIHTPHSGVLFGPYVKLEEARNMYGTEDDSVVTPPVRAWLETWCRDNYTGWGEETKGEGLIKHWSGIMCHSVDHMPLVGAVPGKAGVWIAAGYTGHGMAQILNITRGLAQQLLTGHWDERIPRCFQISDHRLQRCRERAVHPLKFEALGIAAKYFSGDASEPARL